MWTHVESWKRWNVYPQHTIYAYSTGLWSLISTYAYDFLGEPLSVNLHLGPVKSQVFRNGFSTICFNKFLLLVETFEFVYRGAPIPSRPFTHTHTLSICTHLRFKQPMRRFECCRCRCCCFCCCTEKTRLARLPERACASADTRFFVGCCCCCVFVRDMFGRKRDQNDTPSSDYPAFRRIRPNVL